MSDPLAEVVAVALLIGVLAFAIARPRDLPEAVAAAPAALVVCLIGVVAWPDAWAEVRAMAPTRTPTG